MSEYWKEKITDILGRAAGCVILGAIIGLIFVLPNYPVESLGTPIFIFYPRNREKISVIASTPA